MGYQPKTDPRGKPFATRLQVLRKMYVNDEIDVDEFEKRVGLLLSFGWEDKMCPPRPPHFRPCDNLWPVPAVNDIPERNLA